MMQGKKCFMAVGDSGEGLLNGCNSTGSPRSVNYTDQQFGPCIGVRLTEFSFAAARTPPLLEDVVSGKIEFCKPKMFRTLPSHQLAR